jgi:hypothetical protein
VPLCFPPVHLFVISVHRTVLHHSSSDDYTSPPVPLTGPTLLGNYPCADPSLYKLRTRFTGFHLGFLILEGGTDSFSRNVGKELSLLATKQPRRAELLFLSVPVEVTRISFVSSFVQKLRADINETGYSNGSRR